MSSGKSLNPSNIGIPVIIIIPSTTSNTLAYRDMPGLKPDVAIQLVDKLLIT